MPTRQRMLGGLIGLAIAVGSCSSSPIAPFGPPGSAWVLQSIDGVQSGPESISMLVEEPTQPGADASLVIRTGCRTVSLGAYWDKTDGEWVSIDLAPRLATACSDDLAHQDRDVFQALETVVEASMDGDALVLRGNGVMRLAPAP
jgi:hypothetical protein